MQTFDDKIAIKSSLVPLHEVKRGQTTNSLPEQLICSHVAVVNDNEPVKARLIDSVTALSSLPLEGVIYFEETAKGHELLSILFQHKALLGVEPVILKGYPESVPSAPFEQAAWNTPSVAYTDLVAELSTVNRVDSIRRDQAGERQKAPPKEQLLTKVRTRHFDDFVAIDTPQDFDHDA